MLPAGQFFQVFNAKWCYILGILVFEVGSAVCGAAANITVLILGRAIAGIGSTAIYTGTLFLISVNTSEHERYAFEIRFFLIEQSILHWINRGDVGIGNPSRSHHWRLAQC